MSTDPLAGSDVSRTRIGEKWDISAIRERHAEWQVLSKADVQRLLYNLMGRLRLGRLRTGRYRAFSRGKRTCIHLSRPRQTRHRRTGSPRPAAAGSRRGSARDPARPACPDTSSGTRGDRRRHDPGSRPRPKIYLAHATEDKPIVRPVPISRVLLESHHRIGRERALRSAR